MKIKIFSVVLIITLAAYLVSGCVFVSSDFRHTKNLILDELGPADVNTEVQLQIGPGIISLGSFVVSFTDAREEALKYLRDIKNVQVGVYNLYDVDRKRPVVIPDKVANKLAGKGYEPMVKVKERGSAVWVMTKMRGNRIQSLFVISLDRTELVLVEVRGRLERLVEKAIREHGFHKGEFMNM